MGQEYRTSNRIGEAFEYDNLIKPFVSGDKNTDAMERAMYMERMAANRKAKATQHTAIFRATQQVTRGLMQKAPR